MFTDVYAPIIDSQVVTACFGDIAMYRQETFLLPSVAHPFPHAAGRSRSKGKEGDLESVADGKGRD